jgi:ribosome biogenesis GTPase A
MGGVPSADSKSKKGKNNNKTTTNDQSTHDPALVIPQLNLPSRDIEKARLDAEREKDLERSDSSKSAASTTSSLLSPRNLLSPRSWNLKEGRKNKQKRISGNVVDQAQEASESAYLRFYLIGEPGVGKSSLINRCVKEVKRVVSFLFLFLDLDLDVF